MDSRFKMDLRTQGKTTTFARKRLDRVQIDPRTLFSPLSRSSVTCEGRVTMADRTPILPPQRKRGVQTPKDNKKAKQQRQSPLIAKREGAADASILGDLTKNADSGTKMKSGKGRAQEQQITGIKTTVKKDYQFNTKDGEFNFNENGGRPNGFRYQGFGSFFQGDDVGEVEDFRTHDDGKVKGLTRKVLSHIILRPEKCCLRLRESGFGTDCTKKCTCFMDHKRCLNWTMKDPNDATEQITNIPSVVYSYYEKPVRLMLGICHVTKQRWTMDDVLHYMLENAIITGSAAQNKHSGFLLYFPFTTSQGTMRAFQGLQWCPQMLYEFTGNRIVPYNMKGTRQRVPNEFILEKRNGKITKKIAQYGLGGSTAVDACIFQGQYGDTKLENYLAQNKYLQRNAYGRSLLVNFPGKTLQTQRNLFVRYNVSQVQVRQLLMVAYCWVKADLGLSEMGEIPTDRAVWGMFYGHFGNILTKSQFESLLDQVSNSLSRPGFFYEKETGEYIRVDKGKRKQQLFCIGYHGMCYDHTSSVCESGDYKDHRYFVKLPHTSRRIDNEQVDYQYDTENFVAEAEDSCCYESLEAPFDYAKKDKASLTDEEVAKAVEKLKSQYANAKKALIQHCKRATSGSDPALLSEDSIRALPYYAPKLTAAEVFEEKPPLQDGFIIRPGLKHVLLPLKGKQSWKSANIDLQHDEDCLMHKVPNCLLGVLELVYLAVKKCTGSTVKASIASTSLPMKRLNGNDNLLVSCQPKCLSDMLIALEVKNDVEAKQLERDFNNEAKEMLKFEEDSEVFTICWIQKTVPDITKNTMEAMRLEYPVQTISEMRNNNQRVLVCMIPLSQHGHTRYFFPGPFECTEGEALNVRTDKRALRALTGLACHTLFGTMSVQPTSLLHADGLPTSSCTEPFLCMNICSMDPRDDERFSNLRAAPQCYFGTRGPVNPTQEELAHITEVATLAQATTNSVTKDMVLPTVKSITPTQTGGREEESRYQGGNYLREKFGPHFVFGYSENWDMAKKEQELESEENEPAEEDEEQFETDKIPKPRKAALAHTRCAHQRPAAAGKKGRNAILYSLDCVEFDEDYQVDPTTATDGPIVTAYNIGFDTGDDGDGNGEE